MATMPKSVEAEKLPGAITRVEQSLPQLYLFLALVITGIAGVVTAPFFGPDEPVQALRAISLSHGELMGRLVAGENEPGADIDRGARLAMERMDDVRTAWERQAGNFHDRTYGPVAGAERESKVRELNTIPWAHQTVFTPFGNTIVYPPVFYFPAMLGWRAGEASGMPIFASLRLARWLCALVCIALGWFALRIGTQIRWAMLGLLLLPSVLFIQACCTQDGAMIASAALVAALVSRALTERRSFRHWELALAAILLAGLGMARTPYALLGLAVFLPELELRSGTRRRWLAPAIAFAAIVAASWGWRHLMAPLGLDSSDEANPVAQAAFFRGHPISASAAILRGTWEAAMDFVRRGLYVVGWNDLLPHHGLEGLVLICFVVLIFALGCKWLQWRGSLLILIAVAGSLLGISAAEYVIWTPVGLRTVYGIQPRYWLPVVPIALLLFRQAQSQTLPKWRERAVFAAALGSALMASTLPIMCAHAFWRASVWHVVTAVFGSR